MGTARTGDGSLAPARISGRIGAKGVYLLGLAATLMNVMYSASGNPAALPSIPFAVAKPGKRTPAMTSKPAAANAAAARPMPDDAPLIRTVPSPTNP